MDHNIIVTEGVFKRIAFLRQKAGDAALMLRIQVSGGGCSGFSYNYSMTEVRNEDDIVIPQNDLLVLIDPSSLEFLAGCKVDYIEELGNAYFSISNPNATAKCGCGNSFAV